MKLVPPPSVSALKSAYEQLQWEEHAVKPSNLTLWSQWSRLDPRLAEILVRYLAKSFRELNPILLREENQKSPQPQVLAVLAEFAKLIVAPKDHDSFRIWLRALTQGMAPASPQMFFLRQGMPRPEKDLRQIGLTLRPYRRWGFFGDAWIAAPKIIAPASTLTLMGKMERLQVLKALLSEKPMIRVQDYIHACNGRVHKRTAERDLAEHPRLRKEGSTRGRVYRKRRIA